MKEIIDFETGAKFVKLALFGEEPWGWIKGRISETEIIAEITNKVAGDYSDDEWHEYIVEMFSDGVGGPSDYPRVKKPHNYKSGDIVFCRLDDRGLYEVLQKISNQ